MTHFILVRHGESIWHAENRYAGRSDILLTEHGSVEAALLGRWAQTANLDAIWVSQLRRSQDTAAPAVCETGLQPTVDTRLNELDFGQAEGMTSSEMEQRFPEARQAFLDNPADHPLPGGEDPYKAVERAMACLRDIEQRYPDGKVLVVMHSTLLRLVLCMLLDIPLRMYRTIFPAISNCALTEVRIHEQTVGLLRFNSPIEAHIAITHPDENSANTAI
jgi:broad specificity phosphatase PhoE